MRSHGVFIRPPGNPAGRSLCGSLALAGCLASLASAQQYRSPAVDEGLWRDKPTIQRCCDQPAVYAAERQKFNDYFTKYFFPLMASADPVQLGKAADMRDELFREYLWRTSNEQLQRDLTKLAFDAMFPVIVSREPPPFEPSARYNAVLLIGLLDEQYASRGGANAGVARPYPDANRLLVQIVEAGLAGQNLPTALVVGALVGLERHANLQRQQPALAPAAVAAMNAAALKTVNLDKPFREMDAEVFAWIQYRAASVLAQLGSVGNGNQNYDAVLRLVSNLKSLDDRCATAALLSRFNLEGARVDGDATGNALLSLARDVAAAELAQAVAFESQRLQGTTPNFERRSVGRSDERRAMPGGFESAATTNLNDLYPRRPLAAHLTDLGDALSAAKPVVAADVQAKFDAILSAIAPVIQAALDKDTVEWDVADQVRAMAREVDRITAAPPAAAAEGAADRAGQ
jgi:hypothetical protein